MEKKKIVLGLLVAASPLLLTACGLNKKTVTCTSDDEGGKIDVKLTYNTKKKQFESGSMSITMDLSDKDKDEIDQIKDSAEEFCDMFEEGGEFTDCKTKVSSKDFKADLKFDVEKMNESQEKEEKELDEIVDSLEETLDVECKIK